MVHCVEPLLRGLHCLPVEQKVVYKSAVMCKVHHTQTTSAACTYRPRGVTYETFDQN